MFVKSIQSEHVKDRCIITKRIDKKYSGSLNCGAEDIGKACISRLFIERARFLIWYTSFCSVLHISSKGNTLIRIYQYVFTAMATDSHQRRGNCAVFDLNFATAFKVFLNQFLYFYFDVRVRIIPRIKPLLLVSMTNVLWHISDIMRLWRLMFLLLSMSSSDFYFARRCISWYWLNNLSTVYCVLCIVHCSLSLSSEIHSISGEVNQTKVPRLWDKGISSCNC